MFRYAFKVKPVFTDVFIVFIYIYSSIALGGTSAKFPKNGNLYIFPKTPPPRKAETVFQCMAAAWAQAKLERAQRSYNETSRGMGFAVCAYAPRWVKNLDSERSERRE